MDSQDGLSWRMSTRTRIQSVTSICVLSKASTHDAQKSQCTIRSTSVILLISGIICVPALESSICKSQINHCYTRNDVENAPPIANLVRPQDNNLEGAAGTKADEDAAVAASVVMQKVFIIYGKTRKIQCYADCDQGSCDQLGAYGR